jgi:hypothetical protein
MIDKMAGKIALPAKSPIDCSAQIAEASSEFFINHGVQDYEYSGDLRQLA